MIAFALGLALTATAPPPPAAQAARPAAAPRVVTDADRQAALQRMGFSATAIPLLLKEMADERADAAAALPQIRAQAAGIAAAVNATAFDAAGFERLVRARQTAVDTLSTTVLGRRMALLRSLPAADQLLYARGLVMPRGRPGAPGLAPAAAAPPAAAPAK